MHNIHTYTHTNKYGTAACALDSSTYHLIVCEYRLNKSVVTSTVASESRALSHHTTPSHPRDHGWDDDASHDLNSPTARSRSAAGVFSCTCEVYISQGRIVWSILHSGCGQHSSQDSTAAVQQATRKTGDGNHQVEHAMMQKKSALQTQSHKRRRDTTNTFPTNPRW